MKLKLRVMSDSGNSDTTTCHQLFLRKGQKSMVIELDYVVYRKLKNCCLDLDPGPYLPLPSLTLLTC